MAHPSRLRARTLLFVIGFLLMLAPIPCQAESTAPNVLILNSFHLGYAWSDDEITGIVAGLTEKYPDATISVEYMDEKRFPDRANAERMRAFLRDKYREIDLDLIIALDNPALDMLLTARTDLFPDTPIVFAGYNNFKPALLKGHRKITGVMEARDLAGTLDLALGLHPKATEALIIHDYTASGLALRNEMELAASRFQGRIKISYTPPSTYEEVIDLLKKMPHGSFAINLAFITDRAGVSHPALVGMRLISANSPVPIYDTNEARIGSGPVGGIVLSAREHARVAADLAVRILDGEDPDALPVKTLGGSRPMFDYEQIARFGQSTRNLPAGSILINEPESLLFKHKYLAMGIGAAFLLLAAAVVVLAVSIVRIKRSESERDKIKAQLLHSQKLEAIALLAGGIAHDFNNILSAMFGYLNLAQLKIGTGDALHAYLDKMLTLAERAAGLTQSLLAFSRKQPIRTEPVAVNQCIATVKTILERVMGEDIAIKTALSVRDTVIQADRGQIDQILMNLATNARDAMPKGGIFTIATEAVDVDDRFIKTHGFGAIGRYALITVSDTGTGMDAETLRHIFDPFFSTKEVGKGTGLGMSIVYGLIQQHKGHITVYSALGLGTTFRIYIPAADEMAVEGAAEQEREHLHGSETVLLVEDEDLLRAAFREILEKHGYRVIEASDGLQAEQIFASRAFDINIVIMDEVMPRKSGREAYETMRAVRPGVNIIFMSGYSEDVLQGRGATSGETFLQKPLPPTALLKAIRSVLDEKK